jgi:outer membrane protein TolC
MKLFVNKIQINKENKENYVKLNYDFMMFKRINQILIVVTVLTIFSMPKLFARQLNLDSAIAIAISNNADVKIAALELERARSAVKEAYGYAYPTLDLTAQFSHFIEKPKMAFPDFGAMLNNSVYGVLFKEKVLPEDKNKFLPMATTLQTFALANSYNTTLQLQQVLFSSTVFKGISSSGIYKDLAREALVSKISSAVLNTKKAFYGALLAQEVLRITQESFDNAKKNFENVKAMQKQGMVAEFDALRAEVQVENLRPLVYQMESNLEMVKNNLKIVLGIDQSEDITLEGELKYEDQKLLSENEYINLAVEKNFDLRTMKMKRNFDEALIDLDISSYYPNIAAFGNYTLAGSSDDFNFKNYRQSLVGINFSINLFNGFRTSQKVEQGKINVMKTDESINQLKDVLISQIKTKLVEIKKIQANIDAQNRNIELAQRAYNISELRYKEGTGNQIEIENADLALRQAKTNRLQSVYQYISTIAEIENLIGNLDQKYLKIKVEN